MVALSIVTGAAVVVACGSPPPAPPAATAPSTAVASTAPAAATSVPAPSASASVSASAALLDPAPSASAAPSIPAEPLDAFLKALHARLDKGGLDAIPQHAGAIAGASVVRQGETIELVFQPGVDAVRFAKAVGIKDALYAISTDVHQKTWSLQRKTGDQGGKRIGTDTVALGAFALRIGVEARPDGALPGTIAGASPAYPVTRYKVQIARVTISKK